MVNEPPWKHLDQTSTKREATYFLPAVLDLTKQQKRAIPSSLRE